MNRNPSLHITISDFKKVLRSLGMGDEMAMAIFEKSVPYHIKNRYLISGNKDTKTKAKRVIESTERIEYTAEQFNGLLTSIRMDQGSRRIMAINKGTPEWTMLREITKMAVEFSKTFEFASIPEGVREYILTGTKLMGKKYALNKFKYYHSKIFETYESHKVLEEDTKPEDSKRFWEIWCTCMEEYTGTVLDVLVPEKFVHLIYARQEADEAGADYEDWLIGQFEGLQFLDAVPELTQLYGDNAKLRYEKYKINKDKPVRSNTSNKKEQDTDYNLPNKMSDEEAEYFKMLQARKQRK